MSTIKKVVVLGAGLTGMSAASELGKNAIVLESTERPGGLVKSINLNGYWFDHVIHLLHFRDPETEAKVKNLMGECLQPIFPEAWVETNEGIGRYPLQMHLSGLNKEAICKSLTDLAKVTFGESQDPPKNFEEMLRKSFGDYFCELFMLPYNRKVWKRPLDSLAPSGFQWNIDQPDYEQVLLGALSDHEEFESYNSNGWYPRPEKNARLRGMEVLAEKLSKTVDDIRLNHQVQEIDINNKSITVKTPKGIEVFEYSDWCLSTIPLPALLSMTKGLDKAFKGAESALKYNRVISVLICIEGERPRNRGHWRYYGSEELCFTRLVYMNNFDANAAPDNGWSLLVEIIEPSEWELRSNADIFAQVVDDIKKANALSENCKIVNQAVLVIDPAYVVFTEESKALVSELEKYYENNGVKLLGRYGRWEYSSMAQVMRDGYKWAESIKTTDSIN